MNLFAAKRLVATWALAGLLMSAVHEARADFDVLVTVVNKTNATNGNSIASFGYDPVNDDMYVSGFGAGATMRRVENVSGVQNSVELVTQTQLQLYYRDGDPDRGVSTPLQSAILLNPVAIGDFDPYEFALIADNGFTRFPASTTTDPAVTKRFYRYNLQAPPSGGDGRDVYATVATLSDMQDELMSTNATTNQGRQFAWAGDGQTVYFVDSSAIYNGVWELDPITGDMQRLLNADVGTTEPAVTTAGGVDTIFFRGGGTVTNNTGGIDKITYDGATASARTVAVAAPAIREFLEVDSAYNFTVAAMGADADGNLYFNNTASGASVPERRGIYRLDPQGNLVKVASHAERGLYLASESVTGSTNSQTNRMQIRTATHPTAGETQQLMYAETGTDGVTGVWLFEPGDFNRDGDVAAADFTLFAGALKTRGTALTDVGNHKFDLNGNSVVDWKDVKVLQQFALFPNGDVDFDGVLELADLDVLGANYFNSATPTGKIWTTGDLASVDPLYAASAADANLVNAVDVALLAGAWVNELEQPISKDDLTSRGYAGQFLNDVLEAFGFIDGDFDGDRDVDGGDFLVWQRQLDTTVNLGAGADATLDGGVDAADLAVWQANFGNVASSTAAAAAVPEPATSALAVLAVAGVAALRRGRKR